MALYTQIFNIITSNFTVASGAVPASVTLGLSFTSNIAGAFVDLPNETPATAVVPSLISSIVPTVDSNGSNITLSNISDEMILAAPEANYMDFSLSVSSQDLANIGAATIYKVMVGSVLTTFTDLASAKEALLAPIDQLGGRSLIDYLYVDSRTFDSNTKTPTTTGNTVIDPEVVQSHTGTLVAGQGDSNAVYTDLTPSQSAGLLKIAGILSMDPLINFQILANTSGIASLATETKVWTNVGVQDLSVIELANNFKTIGEVIVNMPSNGPFGVFPFDGPALNLLGSLDPDGLPAITLNVADLSTTKVTLSLQQIDSITSNENVAFHLVNMTSPNDTISFGDVFKIRDTANNIALMTPEQASNLQSLNQSFISVAQQMNDVTGPAPRPIEITPTDPSVKISLPFLTASALANSGFMLANIAQVSTTINGAFGLVTGDDLARLASAGVDSVAFDASFGVITTVIGTAPNSITTITYGSQPATTVPGQTFTLLPSGSRQLIIEQQDIQAISKIALTGLANNNTIDVVVNVDDSQGSVQLPTAIVSRLGIDRITAQDGNLDIGFRDARNAMKSKVAFGNIGDNSDVTMHISNSNDLTALKATMVGGFVNSGVDVIAYDAMTAATYGQNGLLVKTGVNLEMSASNSKNFIDMVAAATRANVAVDFSSVAELGETTSDINGHVVLAASALTMPGSAANFVTTVNAFGDQGLYVGRPMMTYDDQQHRYVYSGDLAIEVGSSGLATSSVEITDLRADDNNATLAEIGALVKTVAKATGAGMALVDFTSGFNDGASEKFGLFDGIQANGGAEDSSVMAITLKTFGKAVMGVSNLYADLRIADSEADANMGISVGSTGDAGMQTAVLTNLSKFTNGGALISGFKGIVIDDHVLNDFWTMADNIEIASLDTSSSGMWSWEDGLALGALNANDDFNNALDLSLAAQSLDIVYALDASDLSSSVGLSKYVIGTDGTGLGDFFEEESSYLLGTTVMTVTTEHFGFYLKDAVSNFRSNANTIDKIIISNAAAGDMSIDLSELGLTQQNFDQKMRWVNGKEDQFILDANNGKKIALQILGLTDHTQFTSADIRELPQHGDLTIIG